MHADKVDIIIPVYKGLDSTRTCIESVIQYYDADVLGQVFLVNDKSPEPGMGEMLCSYAEQYPYISVLENENNLGFVKSVNRGMATSKQDIILLNSDTQVPEGWVARLHEAAYSSPDIASVTPFSNNASICSYPYFCEGGELPDGLTLAQVDRYFHQVNQGKVADLPTAVGFCMYIRRDCLETIGYFDADRYGRGYGEENDFSLRAAAAGYRNLLCASLYVYHQGGASFGDQRYQLMQQAETLLADRYPEYPEKVASFVQNDPLESLRMAVSVARLQEPDQRKEVMAELSHIYRSQLAVTDQLKAELDQVIRLNKELESIYSGQLSEHKQALTEFELRCTQYEQLLADARQRFAETDAALGQEQLNSSKLTEELDVCRQQLERLQRSWPYKLQRFLKKYWKFHD